MTDRHAWIEEGAHPVAPGVHRIPLPLPTDGLRAVNVYAIEAAGGLVLIDSGWALANSRDQLERSLAVIGAGLPDVRRFLVTHMHRDHYTQAIEIRRLFGTPVGLGEGEKPSIDGLLSGGFTPFRAQLQILRTAGAGAIADQLAQMWTADLASADGVGSGHHPPMRPGATIGAALGYDLPDEWITSNQEFDLGTRTLAAISTPGHTRGHVVFADAAAGLLFAGDHVLPHITPSIGFQDVPSAEPLREYLQSLGVVRSLPDMQLLPAHGPVGPSTHHRIDELTEHHAERLRLIANALGAGPSNGYDVAASIGWTRRQQKLLDLDPMSQMLAVCETVYHLDLLVAQGIVTAETGEDHIRRFRLTTQPLAQPGG